MRDYGSQGRQGSLGIIWDYGILFIFRDSLHGELTLFVILLTGLITNVIAFIFLCFTTLLYIMLNYYTCTYLHATVKSI